MPMHPESATPGEVGSTTDSRAVTLLSVDSGAVPSHLGMPPMPASIMVPPPPNLHKAATPGELLESLKRCWPVALSVGLVLAAMLGVAAWVGRPEKVTSFALVRIAANPERILTDNQAVDFSGGYARTQMAMMRSRPVLRDAINSEIIRQLPVLTRQSDPVEWLERELKVDRIDGTEIVRLSLISREDGSDFAPILNAVLESYLATLKKTEYADQLARLDELQRASANADEKLRRLRESLQGLTRDLKGGDAVVSGYKQKAIIEEYSAMKKELAAINARRRDLAVKIDSYKLQLDHKGGVRPDAASVARMAERDLDFDPQVQAKEAEVAAAQQRMIDFKRVTTSEDSPSWIALNRQLEAAREALKAVRAARLATATARHQAGSDAASELTLRAAQLELDTLAAQSTAVSAEVAALKREVDKIGTDTAELEQRRSEVKNSEEFQRGIWERKERLEIELKATNRQRVAVIAPAEPAAVLNRLGRVQEAGGLGLLGLLAGLFLVSFREFRRGRVQSMADVAQGMKLPVLGMLPVMPNASRPAALALPGPAPLAGRYAQCLVESADAIRTRLLHGAAKGNCPVLMVASASPSEGKTTLAVQLAASLARAGRRVLLIDGDLRCPSLHRLFDLPGEPGVCGMLAGGVKIKEAIHPTSVPGLNVLPAGVFTASASSRLAQGTIKLLYDVMRRRYDFIIVDSSPLLMVSDGFLLGRPADGVIFSVRPGVSKVADVYAAYERSCEHHLPFLGVVVNGVPPQDSYARGYGVETPIPTTPSVAANV